MRINLLTSILFATSIFIAACGSGNAENFNPLPSDAVREYQACSVDSDCMVAQNGCCDCANGGEDVAVNKSKKDEFRARFSCEMIMCTQLAREPGCGTESVKCEKGLCSLK